MKNQCYCPLRISVQMICMVKLMQSILNMMFESVSYWSVSSTPCACLSSLILFFSVDRKLGYVCTFDFIFFDFHLWDTPLQTTQSRRGRAEGVSFAATVLCCPLPTTAALSCFLPFTLYPFWTRVRVKGNPSLVITR